jgi:hypothetical protein
MFPNPAVPTVHTSDPDTLVRRLLGGMSVFTMLMTIPQVMVIWFGHQAAGGFAAIVERVSCLCPSLVLVWNAETRQEHLFGVRGLDHPR